MWFCTIYKAYILIQGILFLSYKCDFFIEFFILSIPYGKKESARGLVKASSAKYNLNSIDLV